MSLKAIEMQIALPRIGDAGLTQNQLSHKPVNDQALLAAGQLKTTEELRHKSNKIGETADLQTNKDPQGKKQQKHTNQYKAKKKADGHPDPIEHPYKGHHVDVSM
ncbi:MAG TPA: hypothetical protein VGE40_02655 [Bacilli bacterium]